MAIQLGSAYGKVGLDVSGLLNGVLKGKAGLMNLAQVGQQVGASLQRLGGMMTVGVTLPILAMGAASIKAASDFEETKNKAVVVFGEMSDSVVANANKAANALGVSKTQYLDYASSIAAALKAGGMGVQQSAELAEYAVKHFADLASFHNSQVQDVALAWQSAIRGQYEPIQKYFPFINDAYLKTYGMANGLIDKNTKNLTANQRAIILNAIAFDEQLNPALDDFAETSDGLANSARILKAQWSDALVMLGQNLLPLALMLVRVLNDLLTKFNNLDPTQQKMVLGFMAIAAAAGPMLSVLGTAISVVSSIVGFLGTLGTMGVSLAGIGAAIGTVGSAIAAAAIPILVIIALLVALALTVSLVYLAWRNNWFHFRDIVTTALANIRLAFAAFKAWLRGDSVQVQAILTEMWQNAMKLLEKIFGTDAINRFREAWNGFVAWLGTVLVRIRQYVSSAFTNTDWSQVGKFIVWGIANGMLLGIPALVLAATKAGQAALAQIKRTLGISSPSKAFMELGRYSAQGYQIGLAKAMSAEDVAKSMAKPVGQMMSSQQQSNTFNFASGLSVREVQSMIARSNEDLLGSLNRAMAGG